MRPDKRASNSTFHTGAPIALLSRAQVSATR